MGSSAFKTPARTLAASATDGQLAAQDASQPSMQLLERFTNAALRSYLACNPTASSVLQKLSVTNQGIDLPSDHFAFRTFGLPGFGIDAFAQFFLDHGYKRREMLEFPAKKLRAYWFAPPGGYTNNLPRVFISELKVEEVSPGAQRIIRHYASSSPSHSPSYNPLHTLLGTLPWPVPSFQDYSTLAAESEYAAWVLVNGYALNHSTVSVHRLAGCGGVEELNERLVAWGFRLNDEGGAIKVSPDGGLLQSSTVADTRTQLFAHGDTHTVPASYIEFAQRGVLPQFSHLKPEEVREWHRRDGFEVGNADSIFDSTRLAMKG